MAIRFRDVSQGRVKVALLLAGIAGFAALYLLSVGPYWNISPDSVDYVRWGRSLAAGTGWGTPPINPPLTALVFAAVVRVFPTGYTALNALTPLLIFGSLGFAFRLLERRGGRSVALLVILLSLASIHVYRATTQLLSEPVYMLFSMAALVVLDGYSDRGAEREAGTSGVEPSWLRAWLAGLLILATSLTRTIGIALAGAVLLTEGAVWLRRRRRPNPVLVGFALISVASIPLWQAYSGNSYASGWFQMFVLRDPWNPEAGPLGVTGLVERLRDNVGLLPRSGAMLLNGWGGGSDTLSLLLQGAATVAFAWGFWLALRRRGGVAEIYVGLYVLVIAAHMVMGGDGDYRFLVPVAPLLFFHLLEAGRQLARSFADRRPGPGTTLVVRGLAVLLLLAFLGVGWKQAIRGVAEAHSSPFGDSPIKRPQNYDAQRLAFWIRDNAAPEDRYAAAQRDMFDVLSERRGSDILLSQTSPPEAFIARLEQNRARYLLVDRTNRPLRDALLAVVAAFPVRFRLIRELPAASLYEVVPIRKE